MSEIKKYLEYRKNKRVIKYTLAKFGANAIESSEKYQKFIGDGVELVNKIISSTKEKESDEILSIVIKEISEALKTNEGRLIEILSYIVSLSPEQLSRIAVDAIVSTMNIDEKTE